MPVRIVKDMDKVSMSLTILTGIYCALKRLMTNSYFKLQKVWSSNLPATTKALTPKYFSVSPSLINLGFVGGSFQNRIFKSNIVLYIYIYILMIHGVDTLIKNI